MLCKNIEAVVRRCSVKKVFLNISQNSQENTCAWVSFFMKMHASGLNTSGDCFWKYWEMISKKYCEVFRKTTETCSAKILKGVITCLEVFFQTTEKLSGKLLKAFMQKYWYLVCKKYWQVFCKNIERCYAKKIESCSAKILKVVLQQYWEMCCKNTESFSAKYWNMFCKIATLPSFF